ncbi:MAG: prolipoprotein diacylglyceryl transferase [Pseudomonadota bacterium]
MWDELFVVCFGISIGVFLNWGFRNLPKEGMQMLASVPVSKLDAETWNGVNITYYGVLVAGSCMTAIAIALMLLGSLGISGPMGLLCVIAIFGVCLPSSWILAKVVEKKKHTLTVGGASFVGFLSAPLFLWGLNSSIHTYGGEGLPVVPVLAALCIAYAHGEGLGRLACISFGCCYGRPLSECGPVLRRLFDRHRFVFEGRTKKIAYESGLAGLPVIPIQAVTSVVSLSAGLAGMLLFLKGCYSWSLLLTVAVTQTWRILSETARADYRGGGKWSIYQILAALAVCGVLIAFPFIPEDATVSPHLWSGLSQLWNPLVILSLQAVFVVTLLLTGVSSVTLSTVRFHLTKR